MAAQLTVVVLNHSERRKMENRMLALALKEEADLMQQARAAEDAARADAARALAEEVKQVRETAPKAAVEKLKDDNRRRRDEVKDESAKIAEAIAREREEEQRRKVCEQRVRRLLREVEARAR